MVPDGVEVGKHGGRERGGRGRGGGGEGEEEGEGGRGREGRV